MFLYSWPLLVVVTAALAVFKRRREEPGADWMWAAVLILFGTLPCWIGAMEYSGPSSTAYALAIGAFAAVGVPMWLHGLVQGRRPHLEPAGKAPGMKRKG